MGLQLIYLDPHELIDYENNAKIHTDEEIITLANIIKEFGFDVPVVVDENKILIKGHKRKLASIYLEKPLIPVIVRDDMTEEQKKAARIADNKAGESDWNMEKLRAELLDLRDLGVDLTLTGFEDGEINVLLDLDDNFSFDDGTDIEPSDMEHVEGDKDGRSILCEIAFSTKEIAETFLANIGLAEPKIKGYSRLINGDIEIKSDMLQVSE
ncbi:MAG: ParB/Srx family N-terminal domain-containing protein [Candidatus Kapabacteria bacterium]|nr:ParB/Srx family N-terminal domain-containing protein [Candidatus Kapabacteria bacterium]